MTDTYYTLGIALTALFNHAYSCQQPSRTALLSGALTVLDYLYNSLVSLPVNLLLTIDNVEATLYWLHYANTAQIIDLAVTLAIAEE